MHKSDKIHAHTIMMHSVQALYCNWDCHWDCLRILGLYNLGIKKGVHVVDPVFLLSSNQWMQLATLPIYNNYILVYDQENNATIKKIALYLSKKSGKKIVAFKDLYPRTYADYQERYAGPTEFIGLIAKADIVITNSFHCSAFSIIMNRQFYVIPRTHQKVNSRMENLLSSLEIRNRFITSIEDINNATEIDYNKVTPLIESMKEQSYKSLIPQHFDLTLFISSWATKSCSGFCHVRFFTYLSVANQNKRKS